MDGTIIGLGNLDYVSKKTGNPVKGVSYTIGYKKANVEGFVTTTAFVNATEVDKTIKVGDDVSFYYNEYGRVGYVTKKVD